MYTRVVVLSRCRTAFFDDHISDPCVNVVTSSRPYVPSPRRPRRRVPSSCELNQDGFCADCFYEVCARCSTGGFDVKPDTSVQVGGLPVCEKVPPGATASFSGTTVETLVLEKGYYRTSNQSQVVTKCHRAGACTGGTVPDTICAVGYRGPCKI